ncbi:hypothetical protein ACFFTN_01405 [Aminobacter aganoensis]|uniref:Putative DNA-binding protein (UPF0251 family) n=1 Tax=Aminobacter aganoensis TaxID=83264 RepID=A0A7X0F5I2_9HYPH|nr:hypothetical protein [Aminobacter aganoensis]MBB6353484.1 putative DNA-binding protein (UPF0251 family) [Aminobacter aganoensis]
MADEEIIEQGEQQPNPELERQKLAERLGGIIGRFENMATKRIAQRQSLEDRWLEDLAQYHGRYDADTQRKLNAPGSKKSKLFINLTRPKTDAMSARLMDLLFPTDDKNWGIQPTPVPRLTKASEQAERAAFDAKKKADEAAAAQQEGQGADPQAAALKAQADIAQQKAEELQGIIEEGGRRCDLMAAEIDDQLKESSYHAVKRDQIEDASKLGTGVTKGPVTGDRVRKGWQMQKEPARNPDGTPQIGLDGKPVMADAYKLQMSNGDQPAMRYVDIWSFFPDMDVRNIEDGEGNLERHLMNQKKLRELARLPGFDKGAIRRLLAGKPKAPAPSYLASIRDITGDKQQVTSGLYHVWEYSGQLSAEDMQDLALAMGDDATVKDLADADPLDTLNAIVWFCDGELLKFAIYPYDSGECLYSVFNLIKDESSVFGYGVPYVMRDPQKSLNASWRAMMDNAGNSAGPQIVVATSQVEPADGDWTIGGGTKIWKAKEGVPTGHRVFETFDIPNNQAKFANIIALSKQFIDDMTAMPQIAQGEQGNTTKTVQGMALLMNSANVVFRRIVKNFDDDVTTPDIRRFYDWNMQFNPKDEIKGDYDVDARGSSVLLVREMQAQTLMAVATQLGGHPIYGPMLKNREILRKLFQALMIPSADVVLTDTEIDAIMAQAAANDAVAQAEAKKADLAQQQHDLELAKLDATVAISNMENESKERIALLQQETELIKLAQQGNITLDQIDARMQMHRQTIDSKERVFTAEAAVEAVNAKSARARGEEPKGSGGYISAGGDAPEGSAV